MSLFPLKLYRESAYDAGILKINVNNVHLECSLQSVGINNLKEADQVFVHLPKDKIWGMND